MKNTKIVLKLLWTIDKDKFIEVNLDDYLSPLKEMGKLELEKLKTITVDEIEKEDSKLTMDEEDEEEDNI